MKQCAALSRLSTMRSVPVRIKGHKFRAKRTPCGYGHTHASKKEAGQCDVLHLRLKAGEITALVVQPRYDLIVNGIKVCTYVGDWEYMDNRTRQLVTEDTKGVRTDLYVLKRKLMKACLNIDIKET